MKRMWLHWYAHIWFLWFIFNFSKSNKLLTLQSTIKQIVNRSSGNGSAMSPHHFQPLPPFLWKVRGWHFDYSLVPGSKEARPIARRVYEVLTRWVLLVKEINNIFQPWTHQFQPLPQWSKNSWCLLRIDFLSLIDGTNVVPTVWIVWPVSLATRECRRQSKRRWWCRCRWCQKWPLLFSWSVVLRKSCLEMGRAGGREVFFQTSMRHFVRNPTYVGIWSNSIGYLLPLFCYAFMFCRQLILTLFCDWSPSHHRTHIVHFVNNQIDGTIGHIGFIWWQAYLRRRHAPDPQPSAGGHAGLRACCAECTRLRWKISVL